MQYCKQCERWFHSAEALRQHRQDSSRHALDFLSTNMTTPVRPYAQTTTTTSGSGMAFTGFGGWPASSVTQTARDTAGDDPSKDLISSLKGYDNFALVVPPSLEFASVDNCLRIGSTPVGSTQTS